MIIKSTTLGMFIVEPMKILKSVRAGVLSCYCFLYPTTFEWERVRILCDLHRRVRETYDHHHYHYCLRGNDVHCTDFGYEQRFSALWACKRHQHNRIQTIFGMQQE